MKNAISDILFYLLGIILFVFAILSLMQRTNIEQKLVKTFSKTNYVKNEMLIEDDKSEYADIWNGSNWESPKVTVESYEVLNEIKLLSSESVTIDIKNIVLPAELIRQYQFTGDATNVMSYLHAGTYTKEYEYDDHGSLIAIHFR